MIQPLALGSKLFPANLIQGPLAGISCAPFRRLVWKFSQPAFTCTEMISCKTMIQTSRSANQRYIEKDPQEGPVCFQLSGNNSIELATAVKLATDYGADLIDLNCGCPMKKIRNKGAGSSLLTKTTTLYQLISTMKQHTHLPVSVKIRVESRNEKFNAEVAKVVSDAGADFLIVHGRHWTEHYETPCRHDEIAFFVNELNIPVIGNGDITCVSSLQKMLQTGCAGAMISRAGLGQPWLIQALIAATTQTNYIPPEINTIGLLFIEHVEHLVKLLANEKAAVYQARRFAKYYARSLFAKDEFCHAIHSCDTLAKLVNITQYYFVNSTL